MEVAATLMTSLASAFTPAAATTAATTATTAASSGFSLGSILQGTATALSVLGGLRAAQMQGDARDAMAEDAKLEASMEGTRGVERRTAIRQRLVDDLGARDVAYAASNVDLSFGTPATARQGAVSDANAALSTDVETENIRRNRLLSRSAQYRMMADDARGAGVLKGVSSGLSMLADFTRRR